MAILQTDPVTAPVVDTDAAKVTAPTATAPTSTQTTAAPVAPVAAPVTQSPGGSVNDYNTPGGLDTVEGRMNGMLSKDSDYMKRAETKGKQYAQQRGLLNSSMAAGATQAAAIDAALPIAQQDADWANRNRMQADTMAHERGMETYKQEMLSWDQFLKGVGDINAQDLDPTAKNKAVQSLRDNYFAGSGIAASLRGVSINNGQVVYGEPAASVGTADGASVTQSNTGGTVGSAAPTAPAPPSSGAPAGAAPANDPNDLLSYDSKTAMNPTQRYVFEQTYGTRVQPAEARDILEMYQYASEQAARDPQYSLMSQEGKALASNRIVTEMLNRNGYSITPGGSTLEGADSGKVYDVLKTIDGWISYSRAIDADTWRSRYE